MKRVGGSRVLRLTETDCKERFVHRRNRAEDREHSGGGHVSISPFERIGDGCVLSFHRKEKELPKLRVSNFDEELFLIVFREIACNEAV